MTDPETIASLRRQLTAANERNADLSACIVRHNIGGGVRESGLGGREPFIAEWTLGSDFYVTERIGDKLPRDHGGGYGGTG